MTAHGDSAGAALTLIFDWASRLERGRGLTLWIVIAVLCHAAGIAILGLRVSPPTLQNREAPALVFLPASHPMAVPVAAYVEAKDPSLFAPGALRTRQLVGPAPVTYPAALLRMKFSPVRLPLEESRVLPPLDRPFRVDPPDPTPPAPLASAATGAEAFRLGGDLSTLALIEGPLISGVSNPEGLPVEILIGVGEDGRVRHAHPVAATSTDSVLAAIRAAYSMRFEPPKRETIWGVATFRPAGQDLTQ